MWDQKNNTVQCIYKTETDPTDTEKNAAVSKVGAGIRGLGLTVQTAICENRRATKTPYIAQEIIRLIFY